MIQNQKRQKAPGTSRRALCLDAKRGRTDDGAATAQLPRYSSLAQYVEQNPFFQTFFLRNSDSTFSCDQSKAGIRCALVQAKTDLRKIVVRSLNNG